MASNPRQMLSFSGNRSLGKFEHYVSRDNVGKLIRSLELVSTGQSGFNLARKAAWGQLYKTLNYDLTSHRVVNT